MSLDNVSSGSQGDGGWKIDPSPLSLHMVPVWLLSGLPLELHLALGIAQR